MNSLIKKYDAIDGLRSISMIGILVMHILANLPYVDNLSNIYNYVAKLGELTSLFMMISAFSICCGYYEIISSGNSEGLENFYSKRFSKILPFFAFLTFLDIAITPSLEGLYEGFANVTLVFGFIPHESISVIGVGWTLGVIFVFYLLFPFFVYLMKNRKRFYIAITCSLIYTFICADYFNLGKVDFLFNSCYFLIGCGIYLYRYKIQKLRSIYVLSLIFMLIPCFFILPIFPKIIKLILFTLVLIYALLINEKRTILSNRVMKFLSSVSLEIYLCHMVIFRIIEEIGLIKISSNEIIYYIFVCLIDLIGSIFLSIIFKYIYEYLSRFNCFNK